MKSPNFGSLRSLNMGRAKSNQNWTPGATETQQSGSLHVTCGRITNAELNELAGFEEFANDFGSCEMKISSLDSLRGLVHLRSLVLGVGFLDDVEVKKLKKALPLCEITMQIPG